MRAMMMGVSNGLILASGVMFGLAVGGTLLPSVWASLMTELGLVAALLVCQPGIFLGAKHAARAARSHEDRAINKPQEILLSAFWFLTSVACVLYVQVLLP